MEKSQILRLLAIVLPVLKIVRDMVTGKAIRFSVCGKQAVLAHMWSVNQDTLLHDRQDNAFNYATIKAFSSIPEKLKKSFTVDNGKEFAAHKTLAEATGMKVFFCDPYSPWQRGTNENTNGLLRQFFPKGTSFANVSDDDLQRVVDLINNRPRKRLNFLTPFEVLQKFFL